jgi:hypothetical protein
MLMSLRVQEMSQVSTTENLMIDSEQAQLTSIESCT